MNKRQYLDFHTNFCDSMKAITLTKNNDYTGKTDDPFLNLKAIEALGTTTTEAGIITRMMDKVMRVSSLTQDGMERLVSDEAVTDTLIDLANYSALLAGYIVSKGIDDEQQEQI